MRIYIGNLSQMVSEQDLITTFSKFGQVNSARLIKDLESNSALGFGFVAMENHSEAIEAIGRLNGAEMCQRTLVVNAARGREERGHLV